MHRRLDKSTKSCTHENEREEEVRVFVLIATRHFSSLFPFSLSGRSDKEPLPVEDVDVAFSSRKWAPRVFKCVPKISHRDLTEMPI